MHAHAIARQLGAQHMLVLMEDTATGALVPASGFRKTLPGGAAWQGFLAECRVPGIHHGSLPWPVTPLAATGCCAPGVAVVLLGGMVSEADTAVLVAALPLFSSALRAEQEVVITRGELAAARHELNQSATLMAALDEARRQVDRALVELDAQARTLERARHRAEEAARAKDQFLAMLGHELRNPLAPIVTTLDLLRRRGQWTSEHDVIQRQVGHMMRLVDDLLDVSRIAGGKLMLDRRPVALDVVLEHAFESVQPLLGSASPPWRIELERDLFVDGDRDRLAQVFSNLLTNALKYSDPGTPVDVRARRVGDLVRIEVTDRGIGIEAGQIDSVFQLFEQQGRGLDRAQGGLGLGLAIVRNLVQLHGGRVHAHSDGIGRGSRFTVELPLVTAPMNPAHAPAAARSEPAGHGRVLVVDDNLDALTTLAMALQLAGFEVRTASEGASALAIAADFHPDAAVLDIGLPGMSGYELAPRLQAAVPHPVHLIAVTGYGQPADRLQTDAAGFHAHLVKPVDLATLCDALSRKNAGQAIAAAG